jgi:hypothetical protein
MEDGRECQPCPLHGICIDEHLECEEGFRRVNNRCPEDQEVSLYAEHLASRVAAILRDLSGREECGEKVKSRLTYAELRDILAPPDDSSSALNGAPRSHRRRQIRSGHRFDESKFSPAFSKAVVLFHGSDGYGVLHDESGYRAAQAQLPLACSARRYAIRNWRVVLGVSVVAIAWIYVSVLRRIRAARRERIAGICDTARQFLLEQVNAYRDDQAVNPFIIDTQLRDEIVGHTRHAIQLWKEAEKMLLRDTRLQKTGPVTVDGHPCYYWEWRGRASLGAGSAGGRTSFGSGGGSARRTRLSSGGSEEILGPHIALGSRPHERGPWTDEPDNQERGRYPWHVYRAAD